MLNFIITFLFAFNYTATNPSIPSYHTDSPIYHHIGGVVFRHTQKLHCTESNEWIYFYSDGTMAVCTDTTRIEGTYSLVDNKEGISMNLNGQKLYCRATLDRANNLISITFNGLVYKR